MWICGVRTKLPPTVILPLRPRQDRSDQASLARYVAIRVAPAMLGYSANSPFIRPSRKVPTLNARRFGCAASSCAGGDSEPLIWARLRHWHISGTCRWLPRHGHGGLLLLSLVTVKPAGLLVSGALSGEAPTRAGPRNVAASSCSVCTRSANSAPRPRDYKSRF